MFASYDNLTLPFDRRKQAAVFWYLLTNRNFFDKAKTKVKPGWFTDPHLAKVYAALCDFAADPRHPRLPSKEELVESRGFLVEEPAVCSAMRASVEVAYDSAKVYGLDVLRSQMQEWLQAYIYTDGINNSSAHFQAKRYSEAYKVVSERVKQLQEAKFEDDSEFDFSNLEETIASSEVRVQDGCTFGLKMVDDILTPGGTSSGGGLFRGDTTCIMAPINIGKSTSIITVVVANLLKGKRCLLLIHEGDARDICDKIVQNMLQLTKPQLWSLRLTEEGRQVIKAAEQILKQNLTFVPYIRAQMTVDEVVPLIRQKCETARSEGRPYDLLADDYPELLLSDYAKSARMEDRNRIAQVYLIFTQLGPECGVHVLCAIQTNRSGSRANRDEERVLTREDVAESFMAMAKVTNVITMNRSPLDEAANRVRYYIDKSRSGATGRIIVADTKFECAIAHSDREGFSSSWYNGTRTLSSEQLNYLAPMCRGGEITTERMLAADAAQQASKNADKAAKKE